MAYLHKSVFQSHGYLSSANCHVDSRWVLKVSGFGLHAFTNDTNKEVDSEALFFSTMRDNMCITIMVKEVLDCRLYHILESRIYTLVYTTTDCRLYHILESIHESYIYIYTRVYTTTDYGITYLFHFVIGPTRAYEQGESEGWKAHCHKIFVH